MLVFMLLVGLMFLVGVAEESGLPSRVNWRLIVFVTLIGEIVLYLPLETNLLFHPTAWIGVFIFFLYGTVLAGIPAIILGATGRWIGERYLLPYLVSLGFSKLFMKLIGVGLGVFTAGCLGLLTRYLWAFSWRTIGAFVAGGAVAGLIVARDLIASDPPVQNHSDGLSSPLLS